jgi:hypothetical protein
MYGLIKLLRSPIFWGMSVLYVVTGWLAFKFFKVYKALKDVPVLGGVFN